MSIERATVLQANNALHNLLFTIIDTVKPPNKGYIGDRPVVPCREVVLFLEVFF